MSLSIRDFGPGVRWYSSTTGSIWQVLEVPKAAPFAELLVEYILEPGTPKEWRHTKRLPVSFVVKNLTLGMWVLLEEEFW